MRTIVETVRAARLVGTPLFACSTPDQLALLDTLNATMPNTPRVRWDVIAGFEGMNPQGKEVLTKLSTDDKQAAVNPTEALRLAISFHEKTSIYMLNAHRFMDEPPFSTAVLRLRNPFKESMRALFLLGPHFNIPHELRNEIVSVEEELPNDDALAAILAGICKSAQLPEPDDKLRSSAVDAARGLAAVSAEQCFAISLKREKGKVVGLDIEEVWERKRLAVKATRGLTLKRGGPTFADLGGLASAVGYAKRFMEGPNPPRVIVLLDEIEKSMAGAFSSIGDNTGVSQDAHGYTLSWMEEHDATGMISVGPGGAGKSVFAKALASTFGLPLLELDMGQMKEGTVGASETNLRAAFKVIEGMGRPFFVGTCNEISAIPTPLRRRFRSGVWFFDLLTPAERKAVWPICLKRYGLPLNSPLPNDEGWTGAEIRNCCEHARDLRCTPREAGVYIVPVAVADRGGIARLRDLAKGKFLSASTPGFYQMEDDAPAEQQHTPGGRKLALSQE